MRQRQRRYRRARRDGEYDDLVDGSVRGTVVTTLTMVAVAQVGSPVGLSLLVGLLANKAVSHVSVAEVGRCLAERAQAAATEIRSLGEVTLPAPPAR